MVIELPERLVGTRHGVTYQVTEKDMVSEQMPGVAVFAAKPEVMATARLLVVCEWPAMEALARHITIARYSLGVRADIKHRAPVIVGATLSVTTICLAVAGSRSHWATEAHDNYELVATVALELAAVDRVPFEQRRIAPKRTPSARPRSLASIAGSALMRGRHR